jgi:hypothetical protein
MVCSIVGDGDIIMGDWIMVVVFALGGWLSVAVLAVTLTIVDARRTARRTRFRKVHGLGE